MHRPLWAKQSRYEPDKRCKCHIFVATSLHSAALGGNKFPAHDIRVPNLLGGRCQAAAALTDGRSPSPRVRLSKAPSPRPRGRVRKEALAWDAHKTETVSSKSGTLPLKSSQPSSPRAGPQGNPRMEPPPRRGLGALKLAPWFSKAPSPRPRGQGLQRGSRMERPRDGGCEQQKWHLGSQKLLALVPEGGSARKPSHGSERKTTTTHGCHPLL